MTFSSSCGRPGPAAGFTLVELLVAMGILMVIVMLMANLFKQSTLAWENGSRQAEAGLEARAVLGLIGQELNEAVAGVSPVTGLPRGMTASGGLLDFWTLGLPTATNREAERVRYLFSGGQLSKNGTPLLNRVATFSVTPEYGVGRSTNELPLWVDVRLDVAARTDTSQIRVRSLGRDGRADTADDRALRSWQ